MTLLGVVHEENIPLWVRWPRSAALGGPRALPISPPGPRKRSIPDGRGDPAALHAQYGAMSAAALSEGLQEHRRLIPGNHPFHECVPSRLVYAMHNCHDRGS